MDVKALCVRAGLRACPRFEFTSELTDSLYKSWPTLSRKGHTEWLLYRHLQQAEL